MKKFTMMVSMALALSFSTFAESVSHDTEAYVTDSDTGTHYKAYQCVVTVNDDGKVNVSNFMNSGIEVNFTFDISQLTAVGVEIPMTNVNGKTSAFWLKNKDFMNPPFTLTMEDGTEVSYKATYIYPRSSYVKRMDQDESGHNTWVEFRTLSETANDEKNLHMGFFMDLDYPETSDPIVVPETSGNTFASISTPWTKNNSFYGYYTDVTVSEPGNLTTTNFMYSNTDVTVTFDVDELKNNGHVGFSSLNGSTNDSPDLLDAEGNHATCYAYSERGSMDTIESPYFLNNSGYCYIELYSNEEAEEYGYNSFVCFLIVGNNDYYQVRFDVNLDLTQTGMKTMSLGEGTEYYNLNGMRVVNPEKGIFIKKQGGKTVKVVK